MPVVPRRSLPLFFAAPIVAVTMSLAAGALVLSIPAASRAQTAPAQTPIAQPASQTTTAPAAQISESAPAAAVPAPAFVAALVAHAARVATDPALAEPDRKLQFRALIDRGFDLPGIAQFVLGRRWRTASPEDRQQFTLAFGDYIVAMYAPHMGEYGGQAFKVTGQRAQADGVVVVSSTAVDPDAHGPAVAIDWRAERRPDGYRITDIVVEGVSMMMTKRDEITAVLNRTGGQVPAMIAELRTRTAAQ